MAEMCPNDMPDVPNTSENGGTQANHCIRLDRIIKKEEREKDRGLDTCSRKVFRATNSRISENTALEHGMTVTIIIDLCARKEN